ncbi:MAG: tetratricopeptide repeat protein [Snowella sp.]|nr:tetratricopeptide repeat protein [Snowella sp.]
MQFFSQHNRANQTESHSLAIHNGDTPIVNDDWATLPDAQLRLAIQINAKQEKYATAIALLNLWLTRYPESATDYNYRGLLYFRQGQLFSAIQDYNHAILLNSRFAEAYNNRGNCYALQGNWLNALADYERVIDLNPYNGSVRINLGILLRKSGQYDAAIENLDLALRLKSAWRGRIYAERGYTYYLRGDWNCAIADYHRALAHLLDTDPIRQQVKQLLKPFLPPFRYLERGVEN